MTVRRNSSVGGSAKNTDKPATMHQTVPLAVIASIPSSSERTGWTVLSTADAWNSSRCITEFLEGLMNREADREGIPFVPLLLQSS
jgi:hypothetical protein